MRIALFLCCLVGCLVVLAACSKPQPPEKERPPEPQAAAQAAKQAEQHTELRDTIRRPIDRAKAVETQVIDAAEQQKAAIDAQAD